MYPDMADERSRRDEDYEDEERSEGGKKAEAKPPKPQKEKKEKAPKEKKEKKGKAEAAPSEPKMKKAHPVANTLLATTVVWLILLLTFVCLVFFNAFELKEFVLQSLNPEESLEVVWGAEIKSLNDWESELESREKDIARREDELDDYSEALDEREMGLDDLEADLMEKYPDIDSGGTQLSKTPNDIKDMARTIAAMETDAAAKSLAEYNEETAVAVLWAMKRAVRAEILSAMNDEDRLRLLEAMTAPQD